MEYVPAISLRICLYYHTYTSDLQCVSHHTNDMYSNTTHYHTNQEQTTNHDLYTITDNKLRSSFDLDDIDWDTTDDHKGELIIAYENKTGSKILCPRTFYALYIEPIKATAI